MTTIIKGTLIRVTDNLSEEYGPENGSGTVAVHGSLWVVDSVNTHLENGTLYARSLATGRRYVWFEGEYEVA